MNKYLEIRPASVDTM